MKNILLNNVIRKNLYKKNIYLKNKFKINKLVSKIFNEIDYKKNNFHSLSKKFRLNFNARDVKKYQKFKTVAIFGMGGSILGAEAIYSFLKHKVKKEFFFFNNLNEDKIKEINNKKKIGKTLFIFISKSGNTLETLTNINLIKGHKINSNNTIIITERNKAILNKLSVKHKIYLVEHKNYIGGRYSVLSEVGMLPAYLMGLSVNMIRKNIRKYFTIKKNILVDSTAKISQIYLSKKINSIIFLNYSPKLENFLYWYQQILAESLGKKGRGLLPVISTAPKDHHSLLQLYLDGPKDKLFYIFSSDNHNHIKVKNNLIGSSYKIINNKSLNKIVSAQKSSFITTLKRKKIPYREFNIKKTNEETIGELFAYFISETILIANLIGVNPFNQPAVEEVKILTKKFLA